MRHGPSHARKALPLLAALSLALHVLLFGPSLAPQPAAGPLLHAQVGCPEHDGTSAPADHHGKSHDLGSCCMLCGALGIAIGAAPAAASLLVPYRPVMAVAFGGRGPGEGRAGSVLPVGARAPPHFG